MSDRTYLDFLQDILYCLQKAQSFIAGMTFEEFSTDEKTHFAVVRAFEIVGEAVKRLPPGLKNQYPALPWREMAGMRDKLIHDYFGVNLQVVWETALDEAPVLESAMRLLLANENPDQG
ncbi:MAG: DUF86 domain-containing protein [Acidobacteria bacterium]|nr:DUF86 domain-containing protein [Acidobacteriota bacterium]